MKDDMTKQELMELVLDQLLDSVRTSPECFEIEDPTRPSNHVIREHPVILWQPKFQLNNNQQTIVNDPNNKPRSVLVYYDDTTGIMSCHIFDTGTASLASLQMISAEASVTVKISSWTWFDKNYKKFQKLRKLLLDNEKAKLNDKFLKKLCSIFPAALDKHLLG